MKKYIPHLILLILPALLVLLALSYKASKGEYYIGNQYDPSYVYLINSLNLAQMSDYGVGHFDHPGTPVQVVGAIIIKVIYTFQGEDPDIVRDVFSRAEFYLWKISLVFISMTAIALFLLGFILFKQLGNIYEAILLQLSPFYSSSIYDQLPNITPEIFLVFTIILFIAITISFVNEVDLTPKHYLKYIVGFALICGFGVASKITFFPLIIIPVILLKKISHKALFLFLTVISFIIFVIPAISSDHINNFISWIRNLIVRSGRYGEGPENFIDSSIFSKNIEKILFNNLIFGFSYLMIAITLIIQTFLKFKNQIRYNSINKLIIGIFIAMTIQVFIVAKHYAGYYMIPANMLSITGLYASTIVLSNIFPKYFSNKKLIYLFLILFCFSYFQLTVIADGNKNYSLRRDESHKLLNYLKENYSQVPIINTYGSSSKEYSLYLGTYFSGSRRYKYYSVLKDLFPNYFHYNKFTNTFDNFEDINRLKSELIKSNKFIFHCDGEGLIDNFMAKVIQLTNKSNATYKNVFSNIIGETVYEIVLEPS